MGQARPTTSRTRRWAAFGAAAATMPGGVLVVDPIARDSIEWLAEVISAVRRADR